MINGAQFADIHAFLQTLALSQPRIIAACALLPIFSRQLLPGLLRYAICAALGLVLVPFLTQQQALLEVQGLGLVVLLVKEVFIGFALGFLFVFPFWIFEFMGNIIDTQRGASISASFNPATGNEASPLAVLLNQAFMVFFMLSGGLTLMLSILYDSYLIWGIHEFYPRLHPQQLPLLLQQFNRMMQLTVLFAAPAMIAMLLAELGLGLVNRFAPQLQVFFLAMPIKSALAVLIMIIYAPALFEYGAQLFTAYEDILPLYDSGWRAP
ncbi:type III secretion system export apparatus subunit SctT [Alcaligenes endophyticus]|uniref:Type III secretion system export apparatus subunit SctT n=1 Tax=Alcaligenes endophyticus TaxID=1929088 RepID=A0ABT8EFI9_9BURK|nr:type III secretion system export apparatus subunit SctT [Alcaligenes endophyticus]MCX5590283.1 type III secretion system export apparatus subunit SctT [Alcaligenes endophyticus]MDN4120053.1 type III secretion system export apparatus subunit SctT [Alcaligenes endophyticus]